MTDAASKLHKHLPEDIRLEIIIFSVNSFQFSRRILLLVLPILLNKGSILQDNRNKRPSSKSKRLFVSIAFFLLSVIVILLLLWRMLLYAPPAYKPAAPDNPEQVSPYLTHRLVPDFYNNIQLDDPFNILIEQQGLNDIVARLDWPLDAGFAVVQTPAAVFADGQIQLMAQMDFGKMPLVTTITLNPVLDDNGMFMLNLSGVKMGAVNITPLAKSLIVEFIDSELNSAPENYDYTWLENIKNAVLDNTPFDPIFPVDSIKSVRLSGIDLADEKLTILLTPIEKQKIR